MSPHLSALGAESSDRIVTLDILRGSALLGMIVVPFHQNFRLSTPETMRAVGEWRSATYLKVPPLLR
jgi:uncharacterized membrane protein YeiB